MDSSTFHMKSRARTSSGPFVPIICRAFPMNWLSTPAGDRRNRGRRTPFHMDRPPFHRKGRPERLSGYQFIGIVEKFIGTLLRRAFEPPLLIGKAREIIGKGGAQGLGAGFRM